MALVRWSQQHDLPTFPSDVLTMQREINRMFDSFFRSGWIEDTGLAPVSWSPATDVVENETGYAVKVELPGMNKEDVKITMQDGLLTIRGEKKQQKEGKENGYQRIERSYGVFQRSFALPTAVDASKIDASFKDGILTVTLPRSEAAKPTTIEVKAR